MMNLSASSMLDYILENWQFHIKQDLAHTPSIGSNSDKSEVSAQIQMESTKSILKIVKDITSKGCKK